jgi:hypothetical protein
MRGDTTLKSLMNPPVMVPVLLAVLVGIYALLRAPI